MHLDINSKQTNITDTFDTCFFRHIHSLLRLTLRSTHLDSQQPTTLDKRLRMASPVHSFLFSPPSSPTGIERTHSPLLEPIESFNALNRLLTPRLGSTSTFSGPESDKKSTPTLADGFSSTRAYPSRNASPVNGLAIGYELPPFPASSSSYQARPSIAPALSRHNSFSNPIKLPTDSLPTPATHRTKPWSNARPKTILRAVILAMFVLGSLSYFRSASILPSLGDSLSTSRMRQELVDVEKISMVGGKKVRVTGQRGAPRTLTYAEQEAIGESQIDPLLRQLTANLQQPPPERTDP